MLMADTNPAGTFRARKGTFIGPGFRPSARIGARTDSRAAFTEHKGLGCHGNSLMGKNLKLALIPRGIMFLLYPPAVVFKPGISRPRK